MIEGCKTLLNNLTNTSSHPFTPGNNLVKFGGTIGCWGATYGDIQGSFPHAMLGLAVMANLLKSRTCGDIKGSFPHVMLGLAVMANLLKTAKIAGKRAQLQKISSPAARL